MSASHSFVGLCRLWRHAFLVLLAVSGTIAGHHKNQTEGHKDFIYQHVGKAGGGTVHARMYAYGMEDVFHSCHPMACFNTRHPEFLKMRGMLINVRDPAERFVSAFDWRRLIDCDNTPGSTDTRPRKGHDRDDTKPTWMRKCKNMSNGEDFRLKITYKQNASEMAEALCARGTNETRLTAQLDFQHLSHSGTHLTKFVGSYFPDIIQPNSPYDFKYFVAPLEPNYDFDTLVDSALEALWEDLKGPEGVKQARHHVKVWEKQKEEEAALLGEAVKEHHSSGEYPGFVKSTLSVVGQCCLARAYRDDYELLPKLAEVGCRGPNAQMCKDAINAMVERRMRFLTTDANCTTFA